MSGLEGNGRRSWRRRRPVGEAVAARVFDERSEESARQDGRKTASRSPRPAARLVHHRTAVKTMCERNTGGSHVSHNLCSDKTAYNIIGHEETVLRDTDIIPFPLQKAICQKAVDECGIVSQHR